MQDLPKTHLGLCLSLKGNDDIAYQLSQCCNLFVASKEEGNRLLSECVLSPRSKVLRTEDNRKKKCQSSMLLGLPGWTSTLHAGKGQISKIGSCK